MNVIIKLQLDSALALAKQRPQNEAALELLAAAKELGIELKQMHPGVRDQTLASYYFVEVQDSSKAEQVVNRFKACRAVEAAYSKPPDELP